MDNFESSGLDPEFAASLGRELRRIRQGRKESEELIARRLLLSVSQVKGIERGMHEPFYNPRHYVDAARRYARSMGVDFDAFEPSPAPEGEVEELVSRLRKGVGLKIGLSVAAVAGLAGVLALASYVSGGNGSASSAPGTVTTRLPVEVARSAQTSPEAAAVSASPAVGAAPKLAESAPSTSATASAAPQAATTLSSGDRTSVDKAATAKAGSERSLDKSTRKGSTLKLSFSGTTWVQVVWRDGRRETRTFRARQSLALNRAELQAIVIGNPTHASMFTGGKRIDPSSYRQPGQREARIIGNRLRSLGS